MIKGRKTMLRNEITSPQEPLTTYKAFPIQFNMRPLFCVVDWIWLRSLYLQSAPNVRVRTRTPIDLPADIIFHQTNNGNKETKTMANIVDGFV